MFETPNSDLATVERCSENLAYLFAGNELHFCRSVAANGTIDPCFLLAAYALEQKIDSPVWIVPTYERPQQWVKAFSGIRHLAFAQNITLNLTTVNLPKAGVRRIDQADGPVKEVKLAAAADNLGTKTPGKVVNDMFVPSRERGTHTIPRLYMMAAVVLEQARHASVVALIVNKNGAIVAVGVKGPEEGGCAHAEVKALFSLKGQLPEAVAVFSTLKPCTMCAGLLYGLDPGGKLRKYWARADPSAGADWAANDVQLDLAQAYPLDKSCADVKYLKLPGDRSFLEGFAAERSKTWSAADDQDVFNTWWRSYKLPTTVGLIDKSSSPRKLLTSPGAKPFKEAKAAITSFADINQMNLGHVEQSPNKWIKDCQFKGFTNDDKNQIKAAFDDALKNAKKEWSDNRPDRIILFIAQNSGSQALRRSVKTVLVNKYKKYAEPEGKGASGKAPSHEHVGEVVRYLYTFLGDQGVNLG